LPGCFSGAEAVFGGGLFCVVVRMGVSPLQNVTAIASFV
jgi:hypothetical protein